jgi:tetratricopeptide (TPR) repeat protein
MWWSRLGAALCFASVLLVLHAATAQVLGRQADSALVTFRIIVVSTEAAARTVLERLTAKADFEAIARAESIDPSSAQGGRLGPVALSQLRPELRPLLARLGINDIGGPVQVPFGFAVIQRLPPGAAAQPIAATEFGGLDASGSVQPTVSLDGLSEANSVLQQFPKARDWNMKPQDICRAREGSLRQAIASLTAFVTKWPDTPGGRPIDLIQSYVALGQLHAYEGRLNETITQLERAYPRARAALPDAVGQVEEMLGIAHWHRAGIANDVFRRPGDRCLLPRPMPYAMTRDAEKAIDYFTRALTGRPQDYELRWLLNLAYMTTGGYPSKVPAAHLVPPAAFESAAPMARFTDVAAEAGLDSFSSAGGVVVDDFDGDGVFEILTSNFASCGPMQLFARSADGRFVNRASQAGLTDQLGGLNLVQADYDNDGCRDVLVLRGGWETAQRNSLLRGSCKGTFTDVTDAAGLASPPTATQTAAWADIDNDGWLDLFVGNEDRPAQLFHNQRDGRFVDIAAAAGVARTAFTKGVAAGDIDNDGDVDFYLSNFRGGNFLYRNNGNRTFSEVAAALGAPGPDRGFPTWFFDYDNDGWDDLLVSSYYLSVAEAARSVAGAPLNAHTLRLYRNVGGRFEDATVGAGLAKVYMTMGSNFGDVDNDGFLDVYLGTGSPSYGSTMGSVLLRNDGGRRFLDVTAASGTGELHKGHGVAFADLDRDGDLDLSFKVGGATPGDAHAFRLFENPGHGNDWLGLHLVGATSNRSAIGARITVTVEATDGTRRRIHRTVNSGGSFGASPLEQHVGLGSGVARVDVELAWPASRVRQRFERVRPNQTIEVREAADGYTTLARPRLPLRRGA